MKSFDKTNLQNIKTIFEEKTGVELDMPKQHHRLGKSALLVAAAVICCCTMTAFAVSLFSSLSGDDLSVSASYEGNGVVSIFVENKSDKPLNFEHRLKLMRWSTSEEIDPVSKSVVFKDSDFRAHTSGVMTVDISSAYDMRFLEQPLTDDYYYFILTNNNFVFGQDWMCPVEFAEPILTPRVEPTPISPAEADPALIAEITEVLRPYFESYELNPDKRIQQSEDYMSLCQDLLKQANISTIAPVNPRELTQIHSDESVIFDPTVPADMQQQLTSLHRYYTDGYGKLIGIAEDDYALIAGAYIPQRKGDIDCGVEIPLIYTFIYEKNSIKSQQDFAFIRGQLLSFAEMEAHKIYEDEQYVCYDMSDLFYTDLRTYVESMVSQRSDVYFDEQVWVRVQNIYNYYRGNFGTLLG